MSSGTVAAVKTEFVVEPGKQTVVTKSTYDAPRDKVFKLATNPKVIPHWMGPRDLTTRVDRWDFRRGGSWRFVQRDAQGKEYAFHGVFHDVAAPERYVDTFEYEGMPGHASLVINRFNDIDGKTEMITTQVFESVEERDGMVASGMEGGVRDSDERLAELLAKG